MQLHLCSDSAFIYMYIVWNIVYYLRQHNYLFISQTLNNLKEGNLADDPLKLYIM